MLNKLMLTGLLFFFAFSVSQAQYGRNKLQYKDFSWYYIQTEHFDVYFNQEGMDVVIFAARAAEDALEQIQELMHYRINQRISIIMYTSQNDFQETNVIDQYLTEGVGGFTELFKNRVVVPFTGDYADFRHVIHHELVHAVMNDMFYGGSIQNIISNASAVRFPAWFSEGLCEFAAWNGWNTEEDMFIRDAAVNEYLPPIQYLGGYLAYRGGQSVMQFLAKKYGREKIGELLHKIKSKGSVQEGFKDAIGLDLEELSERWKDDIKEVFWPDVARFDDPDDFAKQLTDHTEDGGFFNTSPAISPQGDKIAFISNRDYYFDVFIMDAIDGKVIKRLVKGNRGVNFEELNLLTPGLTWSPDGEKIAIGVKSEGYDVIHIIDVESEEFVTMPFKFDGIGTVHWSPDGKYLAFAGHNSSQMDIFLFNIETEELSNLTDDLFSDSDPAWSPDSKTIYFVSDRNSKVDFQAPEYFNMFDHDYSQKDIYQVDIEGTSVKRLTDSQLSDETYPVASPDGNSILFLSDKNGINNIYKLPLDGDMPEAVPLTNSMNGLMQMSVSKDGKKLAFSAQHEGAYNIFLLNNPFETDMEKDSIPYTAYMLEVISRETGESETDTMLFVDTVVPEDTADTDQVEIYSGEYIEDENKQAYGDSVVIDYSNYVFGPDDYTIPDSGDVAASDTVFTSNLDKEGNYRVNKYRVNFSPDLVYANAGFDTYYGLLGTTVLSFSDMLGNHRLIGMTSLQIDLKNSDYGLAYYYLPNRMDFGIQGFHTARFVYLDRGNNIDLYRFRNYGAVFSASYPLSRFNRFDFGLNFLNVASDNLDDNRVPSATNTFLVPSIAYVHDNSIFGYLAPMDGSRYRFELLGNPLGPDDDAFYAFTGDYRNYNLFWDEYSFAYRLSFGYSGGANPMRFFLGGVGSWINRKWATGEIPINSPSDFAFLSSALPLRGYYYAERIGSKYTLANFELRFPLIRYLITGALPLFFQNVMGNFFVDVGAAWNENHQLQLFHEKPNGETGTKDLLIGMGTGARMYFLYFLLRFDVAWAFDIDHFSRPIYYFSLGYDF